MANEVLEKLRAAKRTKEADAFKSNKQTGLFTFGSTWTKGPADNSSGSSNNIGQSVAELLLGLPDSASRSINSMKFPRAVWSPARPNRPEVRTISAPSR